MKTSKFLSLVLIAIFAISLNLNAQNAGNDQTVCSGDSIFMQADDPSPEIGTWSVTAGSATFADVNNPYTQVFDLGVGTNTLRWTYGGAYDEVNINYIEVTADAGDDATICSDNYTLMASMPQADAVAYWTLVAGSGIISNVNSYNSTISGLAQGANVIYWTVEMNGCVAIDEVVITNATPYVDAGVDATVDTSVYFLNAIGDSLNLGTWSLVAGSGEFANANSAQTLFYNLGYGENTASWTVTNDFGCTEFDDVTVTRVATASDSIIAGDSTIVVIGDTVFFAGTEAQLNAELPQDATGEWSVIAGYAEFDDINDPNTWIRNMSGELVIIRWTVTFAKDGSYFNDLYINRSGATTEVETLESYKLKIYPNPATNVLNVEIDENINQISVFDITGKQLITGTSSQLDLSNLKSGMYILKINTDSKTISTKFVKK